MNVPARMSRMLVLSLALLMVAAAIQPAWAQENGESNEDVQEYTEEVIGRRDFNYHVFLPVADQNGVAFASPADEPDFEPTIDDTVTLIPGPTPALDAEYTQDWHRDYCTNVGSGASDRGLWEDLPGGNPGAKAALLWFKTTENANEECAYGASVDGVPTSLFPVLGARVALNDGARLYIRVYRYDGGRCITGTPLATLAYTSADGVYRTISRTLPAGYSICKVQLLLTDHPDTVTSARASALIDWVSIYNSNGENRWAESFHPAQ